MAAFITDTEEQAQLRATVAGLVAKRGPGYFAERAAAETGIAELWADLGDTGLLGVHLPEEFGGGGSGLSDALVVIEELAAQGVPLLNAVISPGICGSILAAHGSEALKRRWLPGIANGSLRMSFALTEPDSGSNTHEISSQLRSVGEGYELTGSKTFISAATDSDAMLVVARHEDAARTGNGRAPLSLIVVPLPAHGVTMQPIDMAMRSAEQQSTVFFDAIPVPPDAIIGEPGSGLRQVFAGLNPERILASGISNGLGRYAVARAADYAKQREVWGVPIGTHQGVSHPLAATHIAVEVARLASSRAAERFDLGEPAAEASNMAKYLAADASLAAIDQAMQVHGGNGLTREYGLADLWLVARLMKTAPVSREMVLNFVAQTSLGLPASY